MDNIISLKKRSEDLSKEIENLSRFVQQSPHGHLISRSLSNDTYNYFRSIKSDSGKVIESYIPKDNEQLAEQLAFKEYSLQRLKDLKKEKKIIDDYIKFISNGLHSGKYLQSHPGAAQLVAQKLQSKDEYVQRWISADYIRSNDYPERLIVPTVIKDLKVRSKSEAIIVDRLVHFGVPLRYEEEYNIYGIKLHPDFTCLNPRTHKVYYWEHQGRWDDKQYVSHLNDREELLCRLGIIPWINLLITTETMDHPLDPHWVDVLIKEFLI